MVGPEGSVIGVDMNEEMLTLAREAAPEVAKAIGYSNVSFRRGRIQDMALDVDELEAWLSEHPVQDFQGIRSLELVLAGDPWSSRAAAAPLIALDRVDVTGAKTIDH